MTPKPSCSSLFLCSSFSVPFSKLSSWAEHHFPRAMPLYKVLWGTRMVPYSFRNSNSKFHILYQGSLEAALFWFSGGLEWLCSSVFFSFSIFILRKIPAKPHSSIRFYDVEERKNNKLQRTIAFECKLEKQLTHHIEFGGGRQRGRKRLASSKGINSLLTRKSRPKQRCRGKFHHGVWTVCFG